MYRRAEGGRLTRFEAETADVEQQWSWLNARPIPESEFLYLTATISWAESYAPDEPLANPRERVDWSKVPTPTF